MLGELESKEYLSRKVYKPGDNKEESSKYVSSLILYLCDHLTISKVTCTNSYKFFNHHRSLRSTFCKYIFSSDEGKLKYVTINRARPVEVPLENSFEDEEVKELISDDSKVVNSKESSNK